LKYRTEEWDVDLLKYLEKLESKKPVVWGGDLNVALTPNDVYDSELTCRSPGFTLEERTSTPILTKTNPPFVDTFRMIHGDKPNCFTFFSYKGNMRELNKGWRIDYFICSEILKSRIVDSYILEDYQGSDHLPVGIILSNH